MTSLETSVVVRASPERTFEVFTDLERASERVRGIKRIEVLTPGPVGNGTRFRETRVMFGREATEEMRIAEFVPGRSFAMEADSCGAFFRTRFEFRGEGGSTRVTTRMEVEARSLFAKLMQPLSKLMMGSMKKAFAADLDDLRKACEAPI